MKKASEDREGENHEFQQTVMDQRATQQILKKALARLESFYGKQALLQGRAEPGAAAPPPPIGDEGMGEYKANQGSGGVMMLIQNIIDEAHTAESDAIKAEADSQSGYEEFIKNSNDAIGAATKEITAKSDNKSDTAKVQAEADRQAALADAERLAQYNAELHQSCDFLMKNFDLRQSAIQQEIDGLAQAKSILSGADFGF